MAKVSVVERNKKRRRTVEKWQKRRSELKQLIKKSTSFEERMAAIETLNRLPRNASPCRVRNRCILTGRPHGYYRKFGLGRNKIRELAMQGDIPGLVKSSW